MTTFAVSSTQEILAIIGLVLGFVVLLVVIFLLNSTLAPLRKTSASVQLAHKAPMLERGVPGTDQLGQTRRLAESVPELALAYLSKLSLGPRPAPAAPAAPPPPAFASVSSSPPPPPPGAGAPPANQNLPAWQRYKR